MWDKIKKAAKIILGIITGIITVAGTVLLIIFGIKKQQIKETNKKINKLEEENKIDNEKISNNNYNNYDDNGHIK
jgi:uncharacterized membrane protein